MRITRALSAGTTAALSVGAFAVVVMATAPPASAAQTNIPGNAASSWQTNGTVWAIASAKGNVYLGGQFTSVRPPDAAAGTGEVARTRLAALNASTGALVTSFNHNVNGNIYSVAASPDGTRIYVGGDFSAIDGATRNRIAAFDTASGALLTWAPSVNARVTTISVSPTGVYIGGPFSSAGGRTVQRLAELSPTTGQAVAAFGATADAYIYSIALSPDFSRLYVAGEFSALDGDTSYYAAGVVDPTTGATMPFAAGAFIPRPSSACLTVGKVVRTDADGAYFGFEGTGGGCYDGTFSANNDGSLKWVSTCLGATQGVQPVNGTLYVGSHAHDCSQDKANGDPLAFKEVGWNKGLSRHLTARSTTTGRMVPWLPNTNGGASGGLGPRVMASDGTQLFVGGEFTTVNGRPQQGFARFSPATGDLTVPATPAAPTAVARSAGKVSIFVQAPLDLDDMDMTVRLYRDGGTTPIATKDVRSFLQQQPVVAFSDDGQAVGSSHTYRVDVVEDNGTNATPRSGASNSVTVVNSVPTYESAVLADNPSIYWRMNDTHGTAIADSSGAGEGGTTWGTLSYNQSGTVTGNNAIAFDGATGSVASTDAFPSPSTFTVSAWFRTTSTSGGKVVGFGDDQQGWDFGGNAAVSGQYDKHVYMTNDGRLIFGVYNGSFDTLSTPGGGYNDGQWHQIVGTQGPTGMAFYVDGGRVGRNGVTTNQNYTGYWRVGGDNLGAWPNQPSTNFFNGAIDEVAVYDHVLSLSDVTAQYSASGRTPPASTLPTDAYGKAVVQSDATSFWRADETTGTNAADATGNGSNGTYSGGYALNGPSAIGSFGHSFSVDGSTGNLASASPTSGPNVYSEELWFKTNTTSGGKLIGFGNSNSGLSSAYDRHVYMLNDGRVRFGVWNGQADTVTSPNAYNDNQWHHMVATQGAAGMRLYVDGSLVDSNSITSSQPYSGYWRVGGDNLGGWPEQPSSLYFNGAIDEVAVYEGTALTAADVAAHYAIVSHGPDTTNPSTAITSPSNGDTVQAGAVPVTATASDNVGVTSVTLQVDGTDAGTDNSAPYTFSWNATAGSHTLQTVASDAAGNTGTSGAVNVTVVTPPDTTDPSAPGTLTGSANSTTTAQLSWGAATDNVGVAGYQVLRDGVVVNNNVPGLSYSDSGLNPGTSYDYSVRAFDAAGNVGAAGNTLTVTTPTSNPALFSESWPGADGTSWPSAWATSAGNGTVDTQSGAGRLGFNDVANAYARAQLTGVVARTDSEVLLSYKWSATTAGGYLNLFLRGSGGWQNAYRPMSGYGLQIASNSGTVTVQKNVSGTLTNLRSVTGGQAVTTAKQWLRVRVSGTTIEFKTWLDGQAEPSAWNTALTDSSVTAAGQLYVSLVRSAANSGVKSVALDDLQVFAG
jgi:hypothetical protein